MSLYSDIQEDISEILTQQGLEPHTQGNYLKKILEIMRDDSYDPLIKRCNEAVNNPNKKDHLFIALAYYIRGKANEKLAKNLTEAIEDFFKALTIIPNSTPILLDCTKLLKDLKRGLEAWTCERIIELKPGSCIQKLDFSKFYIWIETHLPLVALTKSVIEKTYCPTELDLSYNQLTLESIKPLAKALAGNVTLKKLDLSFNRICKIGLLYLATNMQYNQFLSILLVKGNHIEADKTFFTKHFLDYKKSPLNFFETNKSLKYVDLSQNYLMNDCDELFPKEVKESKLASESFFFLKSTATKIKKTYRLPNKEEEKNIFTENSVVSLRRALNGLHVIIIIESMRQSGQLQIDSYHMTAHIKGLLSKLIHRSTGMVIMGEGKVEKTGIDCIDLNSYPLLAVWDCDEEKVHILKEDVHKDSKLTKRYFLSGDSSRGSHNCFTWAIEKLKAAEIPVDISQLNHVISVIKDKNNIPRSKL